SPCPLAVLHQGREHLVRSDEVSPPCCKFEHPLCLRRHRQVARLGERSLGKRTVQLPPDRGERDAEGRQSITLPELDEIADVLGGDVLVEHAAEGGDGKHYVLDVERERDPSCLVARAREDQLRGGGRPAHQLHQRRPFFAYFWCTACFVTPSSSAIC